MNLLLNIRTNRCLLSFAIIICFLIAIAIPFINVEYSLWIIAFIVSIVFLKAYLKKNNLIEKEYEFILYVSLVAFSVRMLIVILYSIFPAFEMDSDAGRYEMRAMLIIDEWNRGNFAFKMQDGHFFYSFLNAISFYIFGYYPSMLKIFNSFLGILIGINIYLSIRKLFGNPSAKIGMAISVFFPSLIFWQTTNLKEALVVFLLTEIIKRIIFMKDKCSIKYFIVTILYVLLLTVTRNYAGIFMGLVVCIYFLLVSSYSKPVKLIILLSALLAFSAVTYKMGIGIFGIKLLKVYSLSFLNHIRTLSYTGGSLVLADIPSDTPIRLLKFLPIGFVYFMFSPFPWHLDGSMAIFISILENLIWYLIFGLFVKGLSMSLKRHTKIVLCLILSLSGFVFLYSATMGNMGLAYRMKMQLLPIFLIFSSYAAASINNKWRSMVESKFK
ncbi:MAG: hypothetical protein N2645_09825 [Clostridia bacterium]|nr:hypothetical protein [Clostridia bacterium]